MHRFLTILILITICTNVAMAQTDIPLFDNLQSDDAERDDSRSQFLRSESETQTGGALRALERYYNAGKYPEALRMSRYISDSLRLNREETQQFLRYTIASYKEMQYDEQADSAMMVFTKKYPFYDTTSYDPVSFKEEFLNYTIIPRFALYANIIFMMHTNAKIDSIFPRADTTRVVPEYNSESTYGINIGGQFGITNKLSASLGLGFMVADFNRTEDYGATKFYYRETDAFITMSTLALYSLTKLRLPIRGLIITPVVFAGVSADFICQSEYQAYTWFGDNAKYTVSNKFHDLDDKLRFNYSAIIGFRPNLVESKRWTWYTELSWHMMMRPLNNASNRYNNSDLVFNNLFVPDAIHLSYFQWKIGCKYNLVYKTVPKYGYGYKK